MSSQSFRIPKITQTESKQQLNKNATFGPDHCSGYETQITQQSKIIQNHTNQISQQITLNSTLTESGSAIEEITFLDTTERTLPDNSVSGFYVSETRYEYQSNEFSSNNNTTHVTDSDVENAENFYNEDDVSQRNENGTFSPIFSTRLSYDSSRPSGRRVLSTGDSCNSRTMHVSHSGLLNSDKLAIMSQEHENENISISSLDFAMKLLALNSDSSGTCFGRTMTIPSTVRSPARMPSLDNRQSQYFSGSKKSSLLNFKSNNNNYNSQSSQVSNNIVPNSDKLVASQEHENNVSLTVAMNSLQLNSDPGTSLDQVHPFPTTSPVPGPSSHNQQNQYFGSSSSLMMPNNSKIENSQLPQSEILEKIHELRPRSNKRYNLRPIRTIEIPLQTQGGVKVVEVIDFKGNATFDQNGNVIMDSDGNPILDEKTGRCYERYLREYPYYKSTFDKNGKKLN